MGRRPSAWYCSQPSIPALTRSARAARGAIAGPRDPHHVSPSAQRILSVHRQLVSAGGGERIHLMSQKRRRQPTTAAHPPRTARCASPSWVSANCASLARPGRASTTATPRRTTSCRGLMARSTLGGLSRSATSSSSRAFDIDKGEGRQGPLPRRSGRDRTTRSSFADVPHLRTLPVHRGHDPRMVLGKYPLGDHRGRRRARRRHRPASSRRRRPVRPRLPTCPSAPRPPPSGTSRQALQAGLRPTSTASRLFIARRRSTGATAFEQARPADPAATTSSPQGRAPTIVHRQLARPLPRSAVCGLERTQTS